jgi:N-acetylglutamate synthase-like GNAT family acetyltransferase
VEEIKICDYHPRFQEGIERMMEIIQEEFEVSITSPQSTRIYEVYKRTDQKFWVALQDETVAGTIGLELYDNGNGVIKRMMVGKDFRGEIFRTAELLLNKAFEWGREQGVKTIYLGTMEQFRAAQKFYVKKGFTEITKEELPSDYHSNPIDSLYYKKEI